MKAWVYWMEYFEKQIKALPRCDIYMPEAELHDLLVRNYEQTHQECLLFAESGVWRPGILPDVCQCLAYRLHEAHQLCMLLCITQGTKPTQMVIRPPDLRRTPVGKVLRWFLISWWHRKCPVAVLNRLPEAHQYGPPVE